MLSVGMISFTTCPRVVNGMFAVPKGDGMYRLIIDARPANALFVDSPPVHLPTPDILAALEVSQTVKFSELKLILTIFIIA